MVRAFSSATASVKWRANWRDAGTWSLSSTVTPRPRPAMIPPNTRPRPRSATRPARPTLLSSKATRHSTPAAGDTKRCPHGREAQALKRSAILEAELRSMLLPSTTAIDAAARQARASRRLGALCSGLELGACPGSPQRVLEQAGHRHRADAAGYRGEGASHLDHLVEGHVAD